LLISELFALPPKRAAAVSLAANVASVLINARREGACQPFDALEVSSEAGAYHGQDLVAAALGG
jgi:hypothetical protein